MGSIAPLCEGLIAVDGAYELYGGDGPSGREQYEALRSACAEHGIKCHIFGPDGWAGNEVEKRAYMFSSALAYTTPADWLLIVDGDMFVRSVDPVAVRSALAATDLDVAQFKIGHRVNPVPADGSHRGLFRASRGLTVEEAHYVYVIPDGGGKRYPWVPPLRLRRELGDFPEPALDVMQWLTLQHRLEDRPAGRVRAQQEFYRVRDASGIERRGL